MGRMRQLAWLVCAGAWLGAAPGGEGLSSCRVAHAQADASVSALADRLEALLTQGFERPPNLRGWMDRQDHAAATAAIIQVFERESAPRYVRLRALHLLTQRQDPRADAYLVSLLGDPHSTTGRASKAQHAGSRLGELSPQRSPTVLQRVLRGLELRGTTVEAARVAPYLEHGDTNVRISAVRLLARDPTESTTRLLETQRSRDPSRQVREALTRVLKDRSARPAGPRPDAPESAPPPR